MADIIFNIFEKLGENAILFLFITHFSFFDTFPNYKVFVEILNQIFNSKERNISNIALCSTNYYYRRKLELKIKNTCRRFERLHLKVKN